MPTYVYHLACLPAVYPIFSLCHHFLPIALYCACHVPWWFLLTLLCPSYLVLSQPASNLTYICLAVPSPSHYLPTTLYLFDPTCHLLPHLCLLPSLPHLDTLFCVPCSLHMVPFPYMPVYACVPVLHTHLAPFGPCVYYLDIITRRVFTCPRFLRSVCLPVPTVASSCCCIGLRIIGWTFNTT